MKNELKPHSTHNFFWHNLCAYWYLTLGIKWQPRFWTQQLHEKILFLWKLLCQVVPSLIFGQFFLVSWESWEYGDTTLRNRWTQAEKNQISTQLLTLGSGKNHHSCNHTAHTQNHLSALAVHISLAYWQKWMSSANSHEQGSQSNMHWIRKYCVTDGTCHQNK